MHSFASLKTSFFKLQSTGKKWHLSDGDKTSLTEPEMLIHELDLDLHIDTLDSMRLFTGVPDEYNNSSRGLKNEWRLETI